MFEGIDYSKEDSTNRCMELFFNELYKYNRNEKVGNKVTIYDIKDPEKPNLINSNELYVLTIGDGKNKKEKFVRIFNSLISKPNLLDKFVRK